MSSDLSCSPLHVQDGLTALSIACFKGHDQIVEFLLRREADVNHHTKVRLYCLKQAPMNTCSLSKNREWALAQRKWLIGSTMPCYLSTMVIFFIGVSVSEPHTSLFNCDFSWYIIIILSVVYHSVNQGDTLLTRNIAHAEYRIPSTVRTEFWKEHVVKVNYKDGIRTPAASSKVSLKDDA